MDCTLFNLCLMKGEFPLKWKKANLVLISKESTPSAGLPKVRPICLLNDIGKIFERVLGNRIDQWQSEHPESDVSEHQFGFRRHRSTCDALRLLRELTSAAVGVGGFAVVVSLDIRSAFNSIPWGVIRRALRRKGFPPYLRRIIDSYLLERTVWYTGRDERCHSWPMEADVPQGSVLGPVLWNLAFNGVLDLTEDAKGSNILCYADDTLIVVTGRRCKLTCVKASLLVNRVINRIRRLGLSVATEKTEAILFRGKNIEGLLNSISIGDTMVNFQPSIEYLGIMVDVSWTFSSHFKYVMDKTERVVLALNRLMPNLRGPDERRRRLYMNVVMLVILYGAPVWGDVISRSRMLPALYRLQHTTAQRVISAYRTVSSNAALLLARLPPLKFVAIMRRYTDIRADKGIQGR